MKKYLYAFFFLLLVSLLFTPSVKVKDVSKKTAFKSLIGQRFEKKGKFVLCYISDEKEVWLVPTNSLGKSSLFTFIRELEEDEEIKVDKIMAHKSIKGDSKAFFYTRLRVKSHFEDVYIGMASQDIHDVNKVYNRSFFKETKYLKPLS